MNPFKFSSDNKRYHTLYYYNMQTFGKRMYKAVIDAGFTCPNRDGTKGSGGCIFCDGGSGYFCKHELDISEQLNAEITRIHKKSADCGITAYFQSGTNTYAPIERLREVFEPLAACTEVDALSIGTRSDCVDEAVVALLGELKERKPLTVELGLQTVHDATALLINRCTDYADFLRAYNLLQNAGIRTCVHIINGLPGETNEDMLKTAAVVGALRPQAIKLHLLHVIRGTKLERLYNDGLYRPMEKEAYIDVIVKQLEVIPAETVIERLTGDGDKQKLTAPMWSADKLSVLGGIDKRQAQLDSWQGKLCDN